MFLVKLLSTFSQGPWKLTPPSVNAQQTWLSPSQTNQTGFALLGRRANKSSDRSEPGSTSLWRSDMRMWPRGETGQVCHLWQVDVERTILLSGASANMAPAWMQLAIEQRISNIENVQTEDTSTVLSDPSSGNLTPAGSNAADSVRSGQLLCNLGTRRRFNNSLSIAKTGPSTKCAPNFRTFLIHLTNRQEFANSALWILQVVRGLCHVHPLAHHHTQALGKE